MSVLCLQARFKRRWLKTCWRWRWASSKSKSLTKLSKRLGDALCIYLSRNSTCFLLRIPLFDLVDTPNKYIKVLGLNWSNPPVSPAAVSSHQFYNNAVPLWRSRWAMEWPSLEQSVHSHCRLAANQVVRFAKIIFLKTLNLTSNRTPVFGTSICCWTFKMHHHFSLQVVCQAVYASWHCCAIQLCLSVGRGSGSGKLPCRKVQFLDVAVASNNMDIMFLFLQILSGVETVLLFDVQSYLPTLLSIDWCDDGICGWTDTWRSWRLQVWRFRSRRLTLIPKIFTMESLAVGLTPLHTSIISIIFCNSIIYLHLPHHHKQSWQ